MNTTTNRVSNAVVVVTGSSGLIGHRLMEKLARRYRVVGLDHSPPDALPRGCSHIECDLTDDASVEAALRRLRLSQVSRRIASVVHLAAYYDFSGEPSDMYEKLTVDGTKRLLRALTNFRVDQFVFSSTLLVMKPSSDGTPINENAATEATWDYPASKLRTEDIIAKSRGDMSAAILRIAGVYDAELGRSPAITEHVKRIYTKSFVSYLFLGDATRGQAFVHLD